MASSLTRFLFVLTGRNSPATPTSVNIVGCVRQPCYVRRGSNVALSINFTPDRRITELTPSVRTTILGITTNYALPANLQNGCQALQFPYYCPLRAGRSATLRLNVPVSKLWAPITIGVQVTLADQDRRVINCFKVNVKVRVI